MNAWLMYVHLNKNINPNPGPCRNECLLDHNDPPTAWIPKKDLIMARKDKEGDYRRISKATWDLFCELYPGSGPAITVNFYEVSFYFIIIFIFINIFNIINELF